MDKGKLSRMAKALAAIRTKISQIQACLFAEEEPGKKIPQRAKEIGQNILQSRLARANDDILSKTLQEARFVPAWSRFMANRHIADDP